MIETTITELGMHEIYDMAYRCNSCESKDTFIFEDYTFCPNCGKKIDKKN